MAPSTPPLLERVALAYLRRRASGGSSAVGDGPSAALRPEQQAALRRIEGWAIARATVVGAASGGVAATGELVARAAGWASDAPGGGDPVRFWAMIAAFSAIASVSEIAYLYWDGLRSVHRLASVARIPLFPEAESESAGVAGALVRAALELPSSKEPAFGIDPMRETSKWRVTVAALAYKAKVGVTNFVLKAFIRRALIRAFVRAWLPLVAVPVVAMWNGIVMWRVTREARIRAMGPSAARVLAARAFAGAPRMSEAGLIAAACAVGSVVVQQRCFHPNVLTLLREVLREVTIPDGVDVGDARVLLSSLPTLPPDERRAVVQVLVAATILDGNLSRGELRLLAEAGADPAEARRLARSFVAGERLA